MNFSSKFFKFNFTVRGVGNFLAVASFYFCAVFGVSALSILPNSFSRNLKIGDTGADVLKLQQILNTDSETRVAEFGPGSPGFETSNFGSLTYAAVRRFQEKYAGEILRPVGLSRGTGFVGKQTIFKLQALSAKAAPSAVLPSGIKPVSSAVSSPSDPLSEFRVAAGTLPDLGKTDRWLQGIKNKLDQVAAAAVSSGTAPLIDTASLNAGTPTVVLRDLSRYSGKAGASITLNGTGFISGGNDIYFGADYVARNIKATAGSLTFVVPPLPPAKYKLVVANSSGVSNSTFFIVTPEFSPAVVVSGVNPNIVHLGETVTLQGGGFSNDNEIRTSYGIIEHVASSDGKTLSFVVLPKELVGAKRPADKEPISWQVAVYVSNENGVSEQPGSFILSL
jgi:peptidoglycan hydrolase-like protein with peptidoglycan-binding domain